MRNKTNSKRSRKASKGPEAQAAKAKTTGPVTAAKAGAEAPAAVPIVPAAANDPAPAPPKRYEVIKLGVDTHASSYTVARMIDNLGCQPPQKMTPEAFIEFLKKQLTLAKRVVMVYEAGPYGFSLYRQATAMGVECLVCAPERLNRGRKRVNDKIDGRELLNRLDRHVAGNDAALRLVRPPTIEQEISRREARERNVYRKERQRWIGRGRSALHTLGIARPGRWWEPDRYTELMQQLQARYGPGVADPVRAELERYVEAIHWSQKKLDELTAKLKTAAAAKQKQTQTQTQQPRIKGIGELSGELLDREIGDWGRFKNRRQVASYTGLCPGEDSSGDTKMSLSIDKHGNPRVRAVLVECAWLLPRFQPRYIRLKRWKWVFEEGSKAGKAMRKKAVVALARQLAVDLWRIRTGKVKPQDLGLELKA